MEDVFLFLQLISEIKINNNSLRCTDKFHKYKIKELYKLITYICFHFGYLLKRIRDVLKINSSRLH